MRQSLVGLAFQKTHLSEGPGNVKANAADYESAEADQRNLLYKANELNQQNVQSKAAVVEHKQQGGVEKLGQCCLEDIRDYKHGAKDH
ncbi:hypothetical protein ABKV19_026156 [Rosa sericea]